MSSSKRTNDFPASFVVSGNRDCLTVVNRIYRNPKLEITQNSSLSDTRGGRGTRLSVRPRRLVDERRPRVERSVEIAFLRGSRPHSRARLGVEQGVGVSRVRRVASQGRDETRARIARVSRGRSRRRTRGPDAHRLGDCTDVDDGLRGVHARLHVEDQVRLRLPRAGP